MHQIGILAYTSFQEKKYISKNPQLPLFIFWRVKHLQLSGQGTTVLTHNNKTGPNKKHMHLSKEQGHRAVMPAG